MPSPSKQEQETKQPPAPGKRQAQKSLSLIMLFSPGMFSSLTKCRKKPFRARKEGKIGEGEGTVVDGDLIAVEDLKR